MGSIKTIYFIFGFFFAPLIYAEEKETPLSLSDAKKFAIEHNYAIQGLKHQNEQIYYEAKEKTSLFYPTFGIATGLDMSSSAEEQKSKSLAYAYGKYNIFRGFRDQLDYELAQLSLERSEISLEQEEFKVGLEVEEQFHKFLYWEAQIKVKEEALIRNASHQKFVGNTRSAGLSSKADVMEFDLKDSIIKSEIVGLRQNLEETRINLKRLLGEETSGKIKPVGNLQHQHLKGTPSELLDLVKNHTPSVKLATKDRSISEKESKRWRLRYLPEIDFEARAGFLDNQFQSETGERETEVNLLLLAKLDLFSGFESRWQKKASEARLAASEDSLKHEILTSLTVIETVLRKLKTIETQVDLEENNEEISRKYYEAVRSDYQQGIKNSFDLSSATDKYTESMQRRIEYKFSFLEEKLKLEQLVGMSIPTEIITEDNEQK